MRLRSRVYATGSLSRRFLFFHALKNPSLPPPKGRCPCPGSSWQGGPRCWKATTPTASRTLPRLGYAFLSRTTTPWKPPALCAMPRLWCAGTQTTSTDGVWSQTWKYSIQCRTGINTGSDVCWLWPTLGLGWRGMRVAWWKRARRKAGWDYDKNNNKKSSLDQRSSFPSCNEQPSPSENSYLESCHAVFKPNHFWLILYCML